MSGRIIECDRDGWIFEDGFEFGKGGFEICGKDKYSVWNSVLKGVK